jgi:hypothetical protein
VVVRVKRAMVVREETKRWWRSERHVRGKRESKHSSQRWQKRCAGVAIAVAERHRMEWVRAGRHRVRAVRTCSRMVALVGGGRSRSHSSSICERREACR